MKGSCLCGQLSYTCTNQPLYSGYCHCHACQKRSSAPCVAVFLIKKSAVKLQGKSHSYVQTGGSGKDLISHHCDQCGSNVYADLKVLDNVLIFYASTLNKPEDFHPEGHLWLSSRDPRFEITDDLEKQAGPPMQMMAYLAK